MDGLHVAGVPHGPAGLSACTCNGFSRGVQRCRSCVQLCAAWPRLHAAAAACPFAYLLATAQFDHCFWVGDLNYRVDLRKTLPLPCVFPPLSWLRPCLSSRSVRPAGWSGAVGRAALRGCVRAGTFTSVAPRQPLRWRVPWTLLKSLRAGRSGGLDTASGGRAAAAGDAGQGNPARRATAFPCGCRCRSAKDSCLYLRCCLPDFVEGRMDFPPTFKLARQCESPQHPDAAAATTAAAAAASRATSLLALMWLAQSCSCYPSHGIAHIIASSSLHVLPLIA